MGTAVTVPLSGYGRVGIVVGFGGSADGRALEEVRTVVRSLSLPPGVVKLCGWASMASAQPLPTVLQAALPPGTRLAYEVIRPAPDWPWKARDQVTRTELRRTLGPAASRAAEVEGRISLSPVHPERRMVEWAVASGDADASPPQRATRQRELLRALEKQASGLPARELLRMTGAGRGPLKQLVRRGALRLTERPDGAPISYTRGSGVDLDGYREGAERALKAGGSWVWRTSTDEGPVAAAAIARLAVRRGGQILVLAPDVGCVEGLVRDLVRLLPAGLTVSPTTAPWGENAPRRTRRRGAARSTYSSGPGRRPSSPWLPWVPSAWSTSRMRTTGRPGTTRGSTSTPASSPWHEPGSKKPPRSFSPRPPRSGCTRRRAVRVACLLVSRRDGLLSGSWTCAGRGRR